eukprot:TRINITY_DN46486_c0_g1_i1.p1 TRINITY_DN46486_c0_g1~~TRINITY_DN46486_c0_g1_i1.p1  ORF type:complete len:299 (-),score=36.33 TRINITY_DN46486_c0_g1_i1:94-990(-)
MLPAPFTGNTADAIFRPLVIIAVTSLVERLTFCFVPLRCAGAAFTTLTETPFTEAPSIRSIQEGLHRQKIDDALETWEGDGFANVSGMVHRKSDADGFEPMTYGEITPNGARTVARALKIDSIHIAPVVFADLGSGVGKLVVQAYLEWPCVVQAIGIELAPCRCRCAVESWRSFQASGKAESLRAGALEMCRWRTRKRLRKAQLASCPPVQFLEGDFLHADLTDVTHLYVSSLCLNPGTLRRLAEKLKTQAPKLQAVATLRPFCGGLKGFYVARSVLAEMSWSEMQGTRVTVYRKRIK